jgi:dipeptidyl aminopeptidase/acylaminoacyl peptidase
MRRRFAILVAISMAVAGVFGAPALASFPGANGKLAFVSYPEGIGNPDVWSIAPDGSARTQLTDSLNEGAFTPRWSPDGTKILYTEQAATIAGNESFLVLMDADGSNQAGLRHLGNELDPAWSPDGARVAFVYAPLCPQNPTCPKPDIYTMRIDGTDLVQVTTDANAIAESDLDWSPDGSKIAFTGRAASTDHVYVVNVDGTGHTRLTSATTSDRDPSWSPDGRRIAFTSLRDEPSPGTCSVCNYEVYVMNADGTTPTRRTTSAGPDAEPARSPNGAKIAFTRSQHLYTMNADGSAQLPLTSGPDADHTADWQPLPYTGYPRPRGATPFQASLTPAFRACVTPNRTHGAPLAFASCTPPVQSSNFITVGTPDANGAGANSVGSVKWRVNATTGEVFVTATITDVRCLPATGAAVCSTSNANAGPDYSGQLQANMTVRITDRYNGPGLNEPATVVDIPNPVNMSCVSTASTTTGGTCSVTGPPPGCPPACPTPNRRMVIEFGQVAVLDGGPDGQVATNDNTVFARQGIFVP